MTLINPTALIDPKPLSCAEVFERRYSIPENQRTFDWTEPYFVALWDDLLRVAASITAGRPIGHFLGTIVVQRRDDVEEVIDGQQRLVTLTCLLATLAEYVDRYVEAPGRRSALSAAAHAALARLDGLRSKPRIELGMEADFFATLLIDCTTFDERSRAFPGDQELKKRPVAQKIVAAFRFFNAAVVRHLDGAPDKSSAIDHLTSGVMSCLVLLKLSVPSHEMAYAFFESLNNRGMKLTQADLLKNELFSMAATSADAKAQVATEWRRAITTIGRCSEHIAMIEFLQMQFVSRYGDAAQTSLMKDVKGFLRTNNVAPEMYAGTIASDARVFRSGHHGRERRVVAGGIERALRCERDAGSAVCVHTSASLGVSLR